MTTTSDSTSTRSSTPTTSRSRSTSCSRSAPPSATLEDEEEELEDELEDGLDERGDGPTRIVPRRPGEFLCWSCFLVLPRSQLADEKRMLCRDCA